MGTIPWPTASRFRHALSAPSSPERPAAFWVTFPRIRVPSRRTGSSLNSAANKVAEEQGAELHVVTVIKPITYAYGSFETVSISQAIVTRVDEATLIQLNSAAVESDDRNVGAPTAAQTKH